MLALLRFCLHFIYPNFTSTIKVMGPTVATRTLSFGQEPIEASPQVKGQEFTNSFDDDLDEELPRRGHYWVRG